MLNSNHIPLGDGVKDEAILNIGMLFICDRTLVCVTIERQTYVLQGPSARCLWSRV